MRVELDIFSGRPNPSWELSSAERSELDRYLRRATPSPAEPSPPPLGYRGFIVSTTPPSRVYARHVARGRESRSFAPGDAVEAWLLRTGMPYLDPAVRDAALSAIAGS